MEDNTNIHIGGIKFSEELVQVTVAAGSPGETSFGDLLHLLAGKHINIPFICHANGSDRARSTFCVLLRELGRIQEIINFSSYTSHSVSIIPSVGTLTLYPHRNSLYLLGLVIEFFGKNHYPIHSLSTSISAIAVNTDYCLLENIVEKLETIVTLQKNHAPFRQVIRLTQMR